MATSKNLLAFLKIKGQLKKQNKNLVCLIQYIIFCKPGEQPSQIYLIYLSFVETGTLTRSYSQVPRGTFLKLWRQHIYSYNSKCEISSGVSFFFLRFWAQSLVDLQSLVAETKLPIEMLIDTEEHLRIKIEISHQLEVRLSFRPIFPTSMVLSSWMSRAHIKLSPAQIFPRLALYNVLFYNHLRYIPTSIILLKLILMDCVCY